MDRDRDDTERLRRGDTAGLAGLIERHEERLFRYLLRFLGDASVAEDVFQQTWVQIAERVARYDPARPFAPWLIAVARHLALDQLRRRRPESLDEVDEPVTARAADDPFAHAMSRQRSTLLEAAVASLAPLDREVLALRFEEELALPELATTLDVPLPTAKARLYRALTRLRERLLQAAPAEAWR